MIKKIQLLISFFAAEFRWPVLRPLIVTGILIISAGVYARDYPETDPENLGRPNWAGNDYAPVISPDGRFLIFQSDRPGPYEDNNLWMSENRNMPDRLGETEWSVPVPFELPLEGAPSTTMIIRHSQNDSVKRGAFTVNSDVFTGMASIRFEKNRPVEIFYTAVRPEGKSPNTVFRSPGGYQKLNIYTSRFEQDRWTPPEHLNIINSDFNDRMPEISPDGKKLVFSSDRPGGYGRYDLWMSVRDKNGKWSKPVNMGENFNTAFNEISPRYSPSGVTLFFSSDRPGGFGYYDIYLSRFDGYHWGMPENAGAPWNSVRDDESPSFTSDGLWAYFASDRRGLAAKGEFDIYRSTVPEWMRDPAEILFTGSVIDGRTRLPLGIEATIHIRYERSVIVGSSEIFRKDPGEILFNNFEFVLQSRRIYRAEFSAPGFYPQTIVLDYTGNLPRNKTDRHTVVLIPIRKEEPDEIKRITVPGIVVDDSNGLPLAGSFVEYREGSTGSFRKVSVDSDGRFYIEAAVGGEVTVNAAAPGFIPGSRTTEIAADTEEIEIRLRPIGKEGSCPEEIPECIDNTRIYFDLGSDVLKDSEMTKVELIARIMKKFPELITEVQGHADRTYRGPQEKSYEYNLKLSESRARRVRSALLKLGIAESRLRVVAYSYLKPRVESGGSESLAKNRRVEFRRIKSETGSQK